MTRNDTFRKMAGKAAREKREMEVKNDEGKIKTLAGRKVGREAMRVTSDG